MPYGYKQAEWELAKDQAKSALSARAKVRGQMAYSELTGRINAIQIQPNGYGFAALLDEISREEDLAGRGFMEHGRSDVGRAGSLGNL